MSLWPRALALNPDLARAVDPARIVDGRALLHEPQVLVVPGAWCDSSRGHYLHGQCALFALCLHEAIPGSALVLLHTAEGVEHWVHALVALPCGDMADARGPVDSQGLTAHWNVLAPQWGPFAVTTMPSPQAARTYLGSLDDADPMDLEVARTFARELALNLTAQYDLPRTIRSAG